MNKENLLNSLENVEIKSHIKKNCTGLNEQDFRGGLPSAVIE